MHNPFSTLQKFFQDSWQEMKRVNWPTKTEVNRYTGGVIIFSIALAIVLGLVDRGLIQLIHLLLNK